MHGVLVGEHEVQGLYIDDHVRHAKGKKADLLRREGMDRCSWTEVKRSDGHVAMRSNE